MADIRKRGPYRIDPLSFRLIPRWNHNAPNRLIRFRKKLRIASANQQLYNESTRMQYFPCTCPHQERYRERVLFQKLLPFSQGCATLVPTHFPWNIAGRDYDI